ncbi:GNAT family N-acetyltransferase [Streptomyces sp. NPDC088910]|uniref:GNAT family N-acetyltransferase n=1 Tax=Streptomyces sp. NPDC088910 TaxID=3365911 RepID=UPI0037FBC9F5
MTVVIEGADRRAAASADGIDLLRPADADAVAALFAACSPETVRLRFLGGAREFPRAHLDRLLAGPPAAHDAVVAYRGGRDRLVGIAGFAADDTAGPGTGGELGVLVVDAWQRRGVGTAMVGLLLARAGARGVEHVTVNVPHGRRGLLAALGRRLEPVRASYTPDGLTAVYKVARTTRAAGVGTQ